MLYTLYKTFIEPRQHDEDLRNREIVLNILLAGTVTILLLALVMLCIGYITGDTYLGIRILMLSAALVFVGGMYRLARLQQYYLTACLLLAIYFVMATGVAMSWGLIMPTGVLLYGLLIVLAGILLGARYTLYAAAFVLSVIYILYIHQANGSLKPDLSWTQNPIDYGIVIGFSIVIGVISLVTWLFNIRMEHSLNRAHKAELGLKKQKELLEVKVEERTRELQTAQFEKIQQLYRFAELGQLSTALLHELANHLTSLSLDIEGLEAEDRSRVLKRAKRSIHYIDDMVLRVRDQLQGKSDVRPFNIISETEAVLNILKHRANRGGVTVDMQVLVNRRMLNIKGETVRFRQLMANIISNAIDAYDNMPRPAEGSHKVVLAIAAKQQSITLTVTDWGKGIPLAERNKLFDPFYSTKDAGMGMGLSIARQIAEEHFRGKIYLEGATEHTTFVITLPKA